MAAEYTLGDVSSLIPFDVHNPLEVSQDQTGPRSFKCIPQGCNCSCWQSLRGLSPVLPSSPEDMRSWQIDYNEGDEWKVESLPGEHGRDFPDPKVKKYFVTSYG